MPRPWGLSLSSFSRLVRPFVSRRSAPGGYARLRLSSEERRLAAEHSKQLSAAPLRLSYLALWLKCGVFSIAVIHFSEFLSLFLRFQWGEEMRRKNVLKTTCTVLDND